MAEVDVWVHNSKHGVDIAFKDVDEWDHEYEDHFFEKKEKSGVVMLAGDPHSHKLSIVRRSDNAAHLHDQALAIGYYIVKVLRDYKE
jgi:hypothetical protein